jgi:putative heme-binding domain-containing protein
MSRICRVLPLFVLPCLTFAADPRGDHPGTEPSTPQEELAKFHVPPGFEVQLVAAEPEIQKPINLNFDSSGRLWVTGSELYPWPAKVDANGQPIDGFDKAYSDIATAFRAGDKAPPASDTARDTVHVLSDFDDHGHARKIALFADGLNIPSGIQPLPRGSAAIPAAYGLLPNFDPNPAMQKLMPRGGRHIGHAPKGDSAIVYSIPNIWLLTDWDGDGVAESRVPLYSNFGFLDTHGGSSSYIYWIDGWIYGTHGFRNHTEVNDIDGDVTTLDSGNTYRFRPDGSKIEYFTHGQTNPFGLTFDPYGNLYSADSHSKPVYMLLKGGYYEGIGKQHDGLGFAPAITSDDHGSSAIGGIMYYADNKWPEEYRGNLFNGNPVTQKINRDKLDWHGATPKAIRQPDFLTCDDPWFRPVNLKMGPDGALYIADFYNPIIGHYEVPLTDPHRDHAHGRIWRVVWKGEKGEQATPSMPSDLAKLGARSLLAKLGDSNLEVRRLATNELINRIGHDAIAPTRDVLREGSAEQHTHAASVLEALGSLNDPLLDGLLQDPAPIVRTEAVRVLGEREKWTATDTQRVVNKLKDADAIVRLNAMRALAQHPSAEAFAPLVALAPQFDPQDVESQYALKICLRDFLAESQDLYGDAGKLASADPQTATLLADISLAVKSPDAAAFLLDHLRRTHLAAPRAGEYLKHAALNLPAEKIRSLVDLVTKVGDAPLPQRLALADGLSQAARQRNLKLPIEVAEWSQRAMIEALATNDNALTKRAIDAVRDLKLDAKLGPLTKIATDEKRDGALRQAALEGAANLPASSFLLVTTLADSHHMILRKRAAELLAQNGHDDVVLTAIPAAPQELAISMAGALAKSDGGCDALLKLVEAGKVSPRVLINKAVAGPILTRPKPLRDRATAMTKGLPPEDARLDGVIAERARVFAGAKTDASHGAQIFQQNCAVCHRFRSQGGNVGPNLDGVVARGPARLIEDILDPNRNVDPLFRQTTFETTEGDTLIGANVRDQGDAILFADPTGKDVTIQKAHIKKQTTSALSLMPPIFETTIALPDFYDLLSFLLSPTPQP